MNHADWAVFIIFLGLTLGIGFLSGRTVKNFTHFSVGNRNFNAFIIFCTLSASFIGGGYTIGNAGKVYQSGMIYAFGLLGFSFKELLVGWVIAPRMKKYQHCLSVGDMIAESYGRLPQIITGVFAVLICAGILGAQLNALSGIFKSFFPHSNTTVDVLISFIIIIAYCSLGGMKAVVYTDVLQFSILAIGIPVVFFCSLHYIGGWHTLVQLTPPDKLLPFSSHHQIVSLISLFIAFMFGEILVPPYVQRLFMTNPDSTRRGTLCSALFSIPFFLMTGLIGLIVSIANKHLASNVALPYAIIALSPSYLRGFMLAALIAIIMSSAAGFLNAAAVASINDVIQPLAGRKLDSRKALRLAKFITVLVGVLSIGFALSLRNALDVLLFSYNLWSPIILIPLLAAIFGAGKCKAHFLIPAFGGFASAMIWSHYFSQITSINSATVGVLISALCFLLSYCLFRVPAVVAPVSFIKQPSGD